MKRSRSIGEAPAARGAHERLLGAITELAGRHGYGQLTVEAVLTEAHVSRATFYQYFTNLDDCFASAYRENAERLIADVMAAVGPGKHSEPAVLEALVDAAISRPQLARLLMREGLAAGPAGLLERDALIRRIEQTVCPPAHSRCMIDIPSSILVGGVFRFLSMRMADGPLSRELSEEILSWARAFIRRPESCWSATFMPRLPDRPLRLPEQTTQTSAIAVSSRERILRATASAVRKEGYGATTVSDIVAAAHVSRRRFYDEFPSKSHAFVAAYEEVFKRSMAACAPAFFSSKAWPERVWESALAFTAFVAREPVFSYLGFVECYALGPGFVPRVHDTQLAFTLFLEDGYRQRPEASELPRASSALTAAVIFEAGFEVCRCGPSAYIRGMQPLAVYIALAPFIGSEAAGSFVTHKLNDTSSRAPAAA